MKLLLDVSRDKLYIVENCVVVELEEPHLVLHSQRPVGLDLEVHHRVPRIILMKWRD